MTRRPITRTRAALRALDVFAALLFAAMLSAGFVPLAVTAGLFIASTVAAVVGIAL